MKHGIVTSSKVGEEGHLLLTVQSERAGVTYTKVPVIQQQPTETRNIEEGDHVALEKCDDGLWVVLGVLNTKPNLTPDSLSGQEKVMKFDDGTEISARKDDSGGYNVTISASSDVTLDADGDVTIGDSANAVKLAVQNHTHDYSWTDSGGSGTTSSPNEEGTATAVE